MFERMELFRMAHALALHASARQAEVAANVANADTPGYRARDVAPFSETYGAAMRPLKATRPGHLTLAAGSGDRFARIETPGTADPNGNTVSLESEVLKSVQVKQAHDTALAVYDSTRNILRTALGRGR